MQIQKLEKELEKYKNNLIIVEGIKDKKAMEELGFSNIFVINHNQKSLQEKIEEIEKLADNKKITILTDFDKEGKKLYLMLKNELAKRKVKLDDKLRVILLGSKISHIEGLSSFMENQEK